METGFDPIIGALNTSLNVRQLNQNVISSNIANADTPGYRAKVVDFEAALREVLRSDQSIAQVETQPGHRAKHATDPVHIQINEDQNAVASLDGNTVDRAGEMVKLAQNQLLYDASAEMLKRKLGMLKYAIAEGGGNR